jgi:uncharacterized C2H2 Zn-finger protein
MPNYKCDRCLKEFEKKSQYDYHINRKFPCKKIPPKTADISPKPAKKSNLFLKGNDNNEIICTIVAENLRD